MVLSIYGNQITTVFRLNGADENSASYALGWALENSYTYRKTLIEAIFDEPLEIANASISLQKYGKDGGYTDLEIQAGREFHVIIEAKRWLEVPNEKQLSRYRPRFDVKNARRQRFVSVSAADKSYARRKGLPNNIQNTPVIHFSWRSILELAEKSRASASGYEEKFSRCQQRTSGYSYEKPTDVEST